MQREASKRTAVIGIVVSLALMIGWLSYLQLNQHRIQTRIEPLDPAVIEDVATAQNDHSARLTAIEVQQADKTTEEQLARLQQFQSETAVQLQTLESMRRESEALYAVVSERLTSLEQDLKHLKDQAKPVTTSNLAKSAVVTARQLTKRPSPLLAPFTLIGIETRADESFASIAPNGSSRLDQVQLLKSGESYQSWQLLRLEPPGRAVFISNGQESVVSLR